MLKVACVPSYKEAVCEEGNTILDVARGAGVHINSACGGVGKCWKCKVGVVRTNEGFHYSW